MSFDEELGARLRRARQSRNISQDCLGRWLGVTFQQIQKYESGATRVPPEKLAICADLLDVPVGYFFGHTEGDATDEHSLRLAAAIAGLPSDDIRIRLHQLVLALYRAQGLRSVA